MNHPELDLLSMLLEVAEEESIRRTEKENHRNIVLDIMYDEILKASVVTIAGHDYHVDDIYFVGEWARAGMHRMLVVETLIENRPHKIVVPFKDRPEVAEAKPESVEEHIPGRIKEATIVFGALKEGGD